GRPSAQLPSTAPCCRSSTPPWRPHRRASPRTMASAAGWTSMDDDARSLPQHSWQQSAVEADGGEEVGIDGVLPIRVAQSQHAAARCGRTADIVNQDVHTTEAVQYFPGHLIHALACADIGL